MTRSRSTAIVFGASAAVLVVELAAIRLFAPYVGQSLETFTAIVTVVLAGISFGTWAGGRVADRSPDVPKLIGVELLLGGAATLLVVPLTAVTGDAIVGTGNAGLVVASVVTLFIPASLLSAVSPAVVRLELSSLDRTGSTVGYFSAVGTAGAITGSILTGFVLVPLVGTTAILITTGVIAVVGGMVVRTRALAAWLGVVTLIVVLAALAAWAGSRCDEETRYYCVQIIDDSATGKLLILDDLSHSYVDLADPAYLEFTYTRMLAAVIVAETEGPIDAVFIGGGAYSLPAWLSETRADSRSTVLEVDPGLAEIVAEQIPPPPGIPDRLVVGDGRVSMRGLETDSADVIVGDAFGGRAVPWHLTTVEFAADIDRVLRPDGLYQANLIDGPDLSFIRAMVATLREIWPHVSVISLPERFTIGGNFVVVAGHRPLDARQVVEENAHLGLDVAVLQGSELEEFVGEAEALTDDHAPVDQLLS